MAHQGVVLALAFLFGRLGRGDVGNESLPTQNTAPLFLADRLLGLGVAGGVGILFDENGVLRTSVGQKTIKNA